MLAHIEKISAREAILVIMFAFASYSMAISFLLILYPLSTILYYINTLARFKLSTTYFNSQIMSP
jgi:hypothetical protein